MRDLKIKAFHRGEKQLYIVTGIMGLGSGDQCKIYTHTTSFKSSEAELILFTGQQDMDGEDIYEENILSYPLKKKQVVIGWVQLEDSCFKFKYEVRIPPKKEGAKETYEIRELLSWDGKQAKLLGNRFEQSNILKCNLLRDEA